MYVWAPENTRGGTERVMQRRWTPPDPKFDGHRAVFIVRMERVARAYEYEDGLGGVHSIDRAVMVRALQLFDQVACLARPMSIQALCVVCLSLACKYEMVWPPDYAWLHSYAEPELLHAVKSDDAGLAEACIRAEPGCVHYRDVLGRTALDLAVAENRCEALVKLLLREPEDGEVDGEAREERERRAWQRQLSDHEMHVLATLGFTVSFQTLLCERWLAPDASPEAPEAPETTPTGAAPEAPDAPENTPTRAAPEAPEAPAPEAAEPPPPSRPSRGAMQQRAAADLPGKRHGLEPEGRQLQKRPRLEEAGKRREPEGRRAGLDLLQLADKVWPSVLDPDLLRSLQPSFKFE